MIRKRVIVLAVAVGCLGALRLSAHILQEPMAYLQIFGGGGGMYMESLYLPPVTTGPWAPAWAPDGKHIAFAMQGSLWLTPPHGGEAVELTSSEHYDSQPSWSPDSRRIVFTRDTGQGIDLWVVNADGSNPQLLTKGSPFAVDPAWSPDGGRILFSSLVSSLGESRTVGLSSFSLKTGQAGPVLVDAAQNITPDWAPNGEEFVLVSNRLWDGRRIQGTGGIWTYRVGAKDPRVLIPEETVWHAHPAWSPDGAKIAYSSVRTGDNQVFVASATAGNPYRVTFTDGDAYMPTWSPDSRTLAFVSNAGGRYTLWTIPAVGGNPSEVKLTTLKYKRPTGRLRVQVRDGTTGKNTEARVYLSASDKRGYTPRGEFHRMAAVTNEHYFHTTGTVDIEIPAGAATVEVMKGFEYRPQQQSVNIAAGETLEIEFTLQRIIDLPAMGWYSGDNHMHMNYGGLFGATPTSLMLEADAEDLHVINDLVANYSGVRVLDLKYFEGKLHSLSKSNRLLYFNEEYRPSFAGHLSLLNLKTYFFPQFDGMEGTALAAHYPSNSHVLDAVHAQGGVGGYVHPYNAEPSLRGYSGAREFPVSAALGNVDYFDLMCLWSDEYVGEKVWYRILNLGFRVPVSAGTDAMTDYWRHPPIGSVRVYVKTGTPVDYGNWIRGLTQGRSFVTSGPLLFLRVDGREPGDELRLAGGAVSKVRVEAEASSILPMHTLDIVQNGQIIHTVKPTDPFSARVSIDVPIARTGWIAARVTGPERQHRLMDRYVYAHTNPVFLSKGGQPASSPDDAVYFLKWIDTVLDMLEKLDRFDTPAQKQEVLAVWRKAREVYAALAVDVTAQRQVANVTFTGLSVLVLGSLVWARRGR
jgi:TolB protein